MAKMQRIEVLLSKKLRKSIDEYRSLSGQSISGYIRQALYDRVISSKESDFPMRNIKVISP